MVVASSDKAYGELPAGSDAYKEGMPLEGRGPYDVSKTCTDLIAQSYQLSYSLPIAIIRAGNVYGPADRDLSRIIPSLCDDVLRGRPLTIMSDGTPVREYLYVTDVVAGYVAAYQNNGLGAFNLGTGHAMSVLELTEEFVWMMREVAGNIRNYKSYPDTFAYDVKHYLDKDSKIEILGVRSGEIKRQVLNPIRAMAVLGWRPSMPLRDGLQKTLYATWGRHKDEVW